MNYQRYNNHKQKGYLHSPALMQPKDGYKPVKMQSSVNDCLIKNNMVMKKSLKDLSKQKERIEIWETTESNISKKKLFGRLFHQRINEIVKSYGITNKVGTYIPDIACLICAAKYGGKSEDYTIATSIYSYRLNEVAIMEINKKIY